MSCYILKRLARRGALSRYHPFQHVQFEIFLQVCEGSGIVSGSMGRFVISQITPQAYQHHPPLGDTSLFFLILLNCIPP